ncbi:hypothetical protein H2200_007592 [Cladophialophora chaetospira]|uniref:F-box domain-containing protein n=1 Tax=Cladophialophora chaetospira TaxID=386627 RepID=A0AA39CGJ9_9EURO|nr:hypothetical protein H2200_007592 [Cladophialophora chaetospira]
MAHNIFPNQQVPTLADKLRTQQEVSIDQSELAGLSDFFTCPLLEELHIETVATNGTPTQPATLDVYVLQHYMEQPNLKELTLLNMGLIDEEERRNQSTYPAITNPNPLCHLSTLELRKIFVSADTLTKVLRTCSNLRSFTLTRLIGNRGIVLLYDLAVALRTVSHSLRSLTLGYSENHKPQEISLLPSLNNMSALQHLKVDPTMFIGRRLCPNRVADQPIITTRPMSDFADLLPNTLETLVLDIDIEQVWRVVGYRREILQSIIDARARLPNLKEITLFEDERTSLNECLCNNSQCYALMTGHWRHDRRTADETQGRRDFVKVLRKLGIKLFRDAANGQGRYECTLHGNA